MLNIFTTNTISRNISITNPKLEYWLEVVRNKLDKIITYYNNMSVYVDRPNPLVSFLQSLSINTGMDELDLISLIDNNAKYLVKQFNFTSTLSKGKKHKDVIFKNVIEYFLITDLENVADLLEDDLEDIEPIKALYHNKNDIVFSLPSKTKLTDEEEDDFKPTIIYNIEINKLVVSYYLWMKKQEKLDRDIDPARYLGSYLFPKVLKSFNDMSLLNIVIDLWFNNFPNVMFYKSHIDSISVSTINNIIKEYGKLINKLTKYSNLYYKDLLENIPLLYENGYEFLTLEVDGINKNNFWLIVLSRLDIMEWLISIEELRRVNKSQIEDFRLFLDRYGKRNIYSLIADEEILEHYREKLLDIYEILRSI